MSLRGKEQGIKKIINLTVQGIHHTTHLQAPSAEAVDQRTLPIVWGWTVLKKKGRQKSQYHKESDKDTALQCKEYTC